MRFQNPAISMEERVDDLVHRMTLEEKIYQMQYQARAIPRLGIPEYNWWNECLHGVARNGIATVFPQAIGMAATWNPDLIREEANVISTEARAKHHEDARNGRRGIYTGLTFWSPNINIFRDPRWGRGQETYGEDPYLTSRMGVAFVRGLQGDDPKYFKVIATPKHYAVHSGPEPLRHSFNAQTSPQDLYDTYLPAFEATISDGGAWSVMGAYNRYMGQPCCASDLLLKKILRDKWSFRGYVVSDCGAIQDIYAGHKVVQTAAEASALAVKAGCDLTCGDEYESLFEAIGKGFLKEEDIDRSVKRLMMARFKLGMFDPPADVSYTSIPITQNDSPEHRALALRVARESLVLLKNDRSTLPFKKNITSIAVIGPTADDTDVLLGNYNGQPSEPVTVVEGIRKKAGSGVLVRFSRGCNLAENVLAKLPAIPVKNLFTLDGNVRKPGLLGSYYPNQEFTGEPRNVRIDTIINFIWDSRPPFDGFPRNNYSVRWTGFLTADRTGKYAVSVTMDDGARLYLDDVLILEDWKRGAARTMEKEIELNAGTEHKIKLEYFQRGGSASVSLGWRSLDLDPLQEAIQCAQASDAVVIVLGLSPALEGEEMNIHLKGFSGGDRTDLDLPAAQQQLLEKVMKLNKPTVLVLLNGSALSIPWAKDHVPAILEAWYPGQAGGDAIADALFGDVNPGGRLPVTFYASVNDLPPFTDYSMTGRTYRYFQGKPLFPFGYGLSYTTFSYDNLQSEKKTVTFNDTASIQVTIKNSGTVDGDEVVQLYVRNPEKVSTSPLRSLKSFRRIHLLAGESKTVTLPLLIKDLRIYDDHTGDLRVFPGTYEIEVGASSSDIRLHGQLVVR
ncbi:MAG: glucan 1,4-alpha-glucosidase [Ignavibacteriae bacterium]|nr:MAG: glucan 1,4-alpha-glucosidase [Ignavibacteriota bacterium]